MNKVYACTDLHGMYNLWAQIRDYADSTDTIYFLGDAIDRGSDGINIALEMVSDPRVIYLKGNHEKLMTDAMITYNEDPSTKRLWSINGGNKTKKGLFKLSATERTRFLHSILTLPEEAVYENKSGQLIHMTHAGSQPNISAEMWEKKYRISEARIWNRDHFKFSWPEGYDNWFEIHGHTPVQALDENKVFGVMSSPIYAYGVPAKVLIYGDGHKIDLDLGSFVSNRAALLDLDTFEVKYFQEED